VQQVECVVDELVLRVRCAVLEGLEGRPALYVQRDDLAIHDRLIAIQLQTCSRDSRVHPREVLVLSRTDLDAAVVLQNEGSVAVELQLVDPLVAVGEALDHLRGHRRNERRCRASR
jgi:hypothetical protein